MSEKSSETEHLKSLMTDSFAPLQTGSITQAREKKKALTDLGKALTKLQMEASLTNGMECAFEKKPEQRGKFDDMVVSSVEEKLKTCIAELETDLANGTTTKAAKVSAQESAQVALTTAQE